MISVETWVCTEESQVSKMLNMWINTKYLKKIFKIFPKHN